MPRPLALASRSTLLLVTVLAPQLRAQESKWPPTGPTWETVPAKAFAKARELHKAVMVYVATAECPHCVMMAQQTWPTPEVKAVNDDVVFLAVHRNNDTDWTQRLDVMGYPQTLFADGWGNVLPGGRDQQYVRSKEQVVGAIARFAGKLETDSQPLVLPDDLLAAVPKALRDDMTSPDEDVRIAAWRKIVPKLTPPQLSLLYGTERDALARLEALRALPRDGKNRGVALEVATAAVADKNDYVRQETFTLLGALGGDQSAQVLGGVIAKVLAGRSEYSNPNNMLIAAIKASGIVGEPASIEPLAAVLKQEQANNNATFCAVDALVAIGKKHGRDKVKPALELALKVGGDTNIADRLHTAAKAALKD